MLSMSELNHIGATYKTLLGPTRIPYLYLPVLVNES